MIEPTLDCQHVDELDAAFALGAVEPNERDSIVEHLAVCGEPHAGLRAMIDTADTLAMRLDPVQPRPRLRDRLMTSIAATPQDHRPPATVRAPRPVVEAEPRRSGWFTWLSPGAARGLAAVSLGVVLALGAWNVTLQGRVSESDQVAAALASAESVHRVSGEAGSGLVMETPEGSMFVGFDLAAPPDGRIYELWLLDENGVASATGVLTGGDEIALVALEHDAGGFATFAVTVESERVAQPSGAPVMVGALSG